MACSDARTACTVLWPLLTKDEQALERPLPRPEWLAKIPLVVIATLGPIQCLCLPVFPRCRYFFFILIMVLLSVTLIGHRILYIKAKGLIGLGLPLSQHSLYQVSRMLPLLYYFAHCAAKMYTSLRIYLHVASMCSTCVGSIVVCHGLKGMNGARNQVAFLALLMSSSVCCG